MMRRGLGVIETARPRPSAKLRRSPCSPAGAPVLPQSAKSRSAVRANRNALNFAVEGECRIKTETSDATDRTRLRLSNHYKTETPSPRSFIRRVVEIAFRQVSWLGLSTAIGGDAAFSRVLAQWRTKRRFKGLTVAVTTRDSHPL